MFSNVVDTVMTEHESFLFRNMQLESLNTQCSRFSTRTINTSVSRTLPKTFMANFRFTQLVTKQISLLFLCQNSTRSDKGFFIRFSLTFSLYGLECFIFHAFEFLLLLLVREWPYFIQTTLWESVPSFLVSKTMTKKDENNLTDVNIPSIQFQ